jgi:hypothetical protein
VLVYADFTAFEPSRTEAASVDSDFPVCGLATPSSACSGSQQGQEASIGMFLGLMSSMHHASTSRELSSSFFIVTTWFLCLAWLGKHAVTYVILGASGLTAGETDKPPLCIY